MVAMAQDREDDRANARALLTRFLPRAMADGVLDEVEKEQLKAILVSGVLTKEDVQGVFRAFLMQVHREIAADGILTPEEWHRCRAIVAELRIPRSFLPPEISAVIDAGSRAPAPPDKP
jgi:hypothetical protein